MLLTPTHVVKTTLALSEPTDSTGSCRFRGNLQARASILPSFLRSSAEGSKKGVAEQEAQTASAMVHPKPGTKVAFIPCAASCLFLKMSGFSRVQFVATMPTAVLKFSQPKP